MGARVISVMNGKGGVFKTSISSGIGGLMAAAGWRVLLVDLDPQGNLTHDLGTADTTNRGAGLYESLALERPLTPEGTGRENLSLVSGGPKTEELVSALRHRAHADTVLAASLAPRLEDFDIVIIDCPPGGSVLHRMALAASRYVLVPTKADQGSIDGLLTVAVRVSEIRSINPDLELLGVVLADLGVSETALRAKARAKIEERLGDIAPVLDTVIRHVNGPGIEQREQGRLAHELETQLEGEIPWHEQLRLTGKVQPRIHRSTSGLAQDYADLAREVLTLMQAAEVTA